ncbi:hypothetical protein AMJ40_03575 [candidate division TA06 bacterium DG_26]|uniref:Gingipain domain-containing protein n=1 Tax=candidate division TA06 bacterium DG_26 TaxID=1703771 RepID=A0A0S7WJ54_UNCT6|nr:MAG: hypothetical protein AMJ40_03575 [candidate division TA06 bacterium DG_26]
MRLSPTETLVLSLLALFPFCATVSEELRVLESTDSHLTFEFVPDTLSLQVRDEGTYVRGRACEYTREVGKPLLPIRTLYVGIPPNSSYRVEVLKIESETKQTRDVVPVPEVISLQPVSECRFRRDPEFYMANQYYPEAPIRADSASYLREQRILPITIPLVRYNPGEGSLMILTLMRARVIFSPGTHRLWRPDPMEEVFRALLLNYEQARLWRARPVGKTKRDDPFIQSNFWYKLSIETEGVYKVGYERIKSLGIDPASIDPRTLKLYNGGGKPLPRDLDEPRPSFRQVPVWVEGESDGRFDSSDYLLFYAMSPSRWEYDSTPAEYVYFENPYTDVNVFWLTWGGEEGLRMGTVDGSPSDPNPVTPSDYVTPLRIEENRSNPLKEADKWEWEVIESAGERKYRFDLHGVQTDSLAHLRARLRTSQPRNADDVVHRVRISLNGYTLVDTTLDNPAALQLEAWTNTLLEGENELQVQNLGDGNSILNVDFFEITYTREYRAWLNQLAFTSPPAFVPGTYEFEISEFTSGEPLLVDVTDPLAPHMIINCDVSAASVRFQRQIDTRRFYHLCSRDAVRTPLHMELADVVHLRSSPGADYIALVHDDFFYAVQALVSWRRQQFQNPMAVRLSSVYDEFSWGLQDPTAIRDFIKYFYDNGMYKPTHCLLVGDGTYDYKNYLGQTYSDNFIPPTTGCRDNWYGQIDPDDALRDVCIGRINPHSPQEAQSMIARMVEYESKPNRGFWRNKVLLLADNLIEPGGDFPRDTELLARDHIPNHFDIRKIHLVYKLYNDPEEWSTATEDAIQEWRAGFLAGCYMGHGGPHTVANEQLLLYKDIFSFRNETRLPFFYFASCDIGRFDVPDDPCVGEQLLKLDDGGAIAVLAASRGTYHEDNNQVASLLFHEMFIDQQSPTLGEAFLVAKPQVSVHTLFGDPAMRIVKPTPSITISATPDSLVRRSWVHVNISTPQTVSGYANIYAFDSAEPYEYDSDTLHITGTPIFKGTVAFDGADTLSFMVPGQLEEGDLGRIVSYAWSDTRELVGLLDSLKVGGSVPTPPDSVGPSIVLFEGSRVLQDEDFVPQTFELVGVCEDESGIYIIPRRPPWFLLEVNGYAEADLSRYFTYDVGSNTRGRFVYRLRLDDGENTVRVVARDNLLERSSKEIKLQVSSPSELAIRYAFNYPNPISDWTYFNFYLTQGAECEIKVFTISGRLIRTIPDIRGEVGQNQVFWDGRDSDGDSIANGVYIYKIIARSHSDESEWGKVSAEASIVEKLVVMR